MSAVKEGRHNIIVDRQKVSIIIMIKNITYSYGEDANTNLFWSTHKQICPFLLRIFLCEGHHFPMSDYTNRRIPPKHAELQIYTWLDATLSELTDLIREMPDYNSKGTQFSFSVVFPEPSAPSYRMRSIGATVGGKRGPDDELTLSQCRYQIGDFIDVAITVPGSDNARLGPPSSKKMRHDNRGGDGGGPGPRRDRGPPQGRFR